MKIKDTIAAEFDAFSENYTSDMQKCVPHYDYLLSCFSSGFSANLEPQRILDLGCGNGNVTQELLKIFPRAKYTLLDVSQEMLNSCSERFKETKIKPITSYFNDYKFPSNSFDIVAAGFSMHHCSAIDKQELFKKIYNSLRDTGVLTLSDLIIDKNDVNHSKLIEQWGKLVNSHFPDGEKWTWIMEHYDEYDKPDSLENQLKWLRNVGFRDIEILIKDQYWVHFKSVK